MPSSALGFPPISPKPHLPITPMATFRPDAGKATPEKLPAPTSVHLTDHFDRLPDSLLLLVFNKIGDVKALGRCCAVSKRFHCLVSQVDDVIVKVDCVIADDDSGIHDKSKGLLIQLVRAFIGNIIKPLQSLHHLFVPSRKSNLTDVSHHSPTEVLKNFNEIQTLRIELPGGELGIEDGVLLKWRADFGSTLVNCVILGASSWEIKSNTNPSLDFDFNENPSRNFDLNGDFDGGCIPESFYTNGGLKLRVVWTISSLIAASARHFLLQQIISDHPTLESLVLTDSDDQGVLCMNKEQLQELRMKPLSASASSNRTMVPALNMKLWYAPHMELPGGVVLKGATLAAIRPSEQCELGRKESMENWVSMAFEEPFRTAAALLVKRRTYCLEMNAF